MITALRFASYSVAVALGVLALSPCTQAMNRGFPNETMGFGSNAIPPAVIRQPVVPEMLVPCRGHVLVPALGMTFVRQGEPTPASGQYLREENLTAPYRVLPPGAMVTKDHSPARLNVELDTMKRIIGFYCG